MNLTGNTILITGGSSGIGLELIRQLVPKKNKIIITGRNPSKLDKVRKEFPQVEVIASDVCNAQEIKNLHEKITRDFPDLNILINNAGIMRTINVHEKQNDLEELTREIETNLNGPIRMVQQFLPGLKMQKSAAIVNVTSGLAFVPLPTCPVYCSTKAGLHSYTLSLRTQLKKTNVQVFELAPPATQTELLGEFDPHDMKGISIMKVQDMVAAAIKGMEANQFEIRPGQSNQLKFMSRLAPQFILDQLSKPVDRMLQNRRN